MSQDSRDCLATVIRRSCECSEYAATKFWRIYNVKISRHSYNCRMNVARQSRDNLENTCEHLATIWREIKIRRHECHETRSRMSRDFRTNENEAKATFLGIRKTPTNVSRLSYVRQSRVIFPKINRNSPICRINAHSMTLQRESCIYNMLLIFVAK